jgi:RNA polymerase sigma-70 factor, ECF subfamily
MTNLNVTQLLLDWSNGDKSALDKLTPLIYDELHRLANSYMRRQSPGHTLQATALVNEVYIKLINSENSSWRNRAHFFAVAAQAMRQILIDHARRHKYAKRGGGSHKVELDEVAVIAQEQAANLVALDEALKSLYAIDQRKSQIVELRFFGGLNIDETAEVLKISAPTVQREWRMAKAWLHRELSNQHGS